MTQKTKNDTVAVLCSKCNKSISIMISCDDYSSLQSMVVISDKIKIICDACVVHAEYLISSGEKLSNSVAQQYCKSYEILLSEIAVGIRHTVKFEWEHVENLHKFLTDLGLSNPSLKQVVQNKNAFAKADSKGQLWWECSLGFAKELAALLESKLSEASNVKEPV